VRRTAALALLALAAAGCGGGDGEQRGGALVWSERPSLLVATGAPDRVLLGKVRNDSLEPVEIRAADVSVLDADGGRIAATAIFTHGLARPLYQQDRDRQLPESDARRIGRIVSLKPGQEAPLAIGWRQRSGDATPARIDYGAGSLAIGATKRVMPR
jgi:hypothetical protein